MCGLGIISNIGTAYTGAPTEFLYFRLQSFQLLRTAHPEKSVQAGNAQPAFLFASEQLEEVGWLGHVNKTVLALLIPLLLIKLP